MKLDKQQINAVASKVLNEIQIANYKKANSVENIKIIEEFKKKHEKLNKQYNVLHEEIIELSKILTKKLNIEYVYGLSHVTKTEVIINSIKNVLLRKIYKIHVILKYIHTKTIYLDFDKPLRL